MKELVASLVPLVPSIGIAFSIAAFVIAVSHWANKTLSDDILLRTSLWILGDAGSIKADAILGALFSRIAGPHFGWKRLGVILAANFCIGSAAYLWYKVLNFSSGPFVLSFDTHLNELVLSRSSDRRVWTLERNFRELVSFYILLLLGGVPVHIVTFSTTGMLLRTVLRQVSATRVIVFVIAELLIVFIVDTAWIQVFDDLPSVLERQGTLSGRFLSSYNQFVDVYFDGDELTNPLYFTKYIFSLLWVSVALSFLVLGMINRHGAFLAAKIAPLIKRKRIEEEPIVLLGELVAGMSFVGIVTYGLIFVQPQPSARGGSSSKLHLQGQFVRELSGGMFKVAVDYSYACGATACPLHRPLDSNRHEAPT